MWSMFKRDDRGVTAIEYATFVAGIGLALVAVMPLLQTSMTKVYTPIIAALNADGDQLVPGKAGDAHPHPAAVTASGDGTRLAAASGSKPDPRQAPVGDEYSNIMTGSINRAAPLVEMKTPVLRRSIDDEPDGVTARPLAGN